MQKKIAIVNQDSGYLMIDIANAYSRAGHKVSLVTGWLNQRDIALAPEIGLSKIIKYNRSSPFKRLFTWFFAAFQIIFLLWFKYHNYHLLIVSNPPFAPLLSLFTRNKFDLLIYDIYPDALHEMGVFSSSSFIVKYWKKINKRVFAKANRIITITNGMKEVLQNYSGIKQVEVIPIWTDNNFLKPIVKSKNTFIKKHHLKDKFIVMYSGNLGYAHDVEVIVELARLTENPDIRFIIIGEGEKKKMLEDKAKEYQLSNLTLLPFLPAAELPYSISSADLAIVTLGKDASKLSVPSKTYNLMSVGAALLCIVGKASELSSLVKQYGVGKCFEATELDEMKNFIMELFNDPSKLKDYRSNALKASLDFGVENAKLFVN